MSKENKNQIGDGSDNFGQAAKQAANAAKQVGRKSAEQAAAKGAEATANAAASTVKVGVEAGKAVSNVAVGTATGGPVGAIISAAWSMRHTLFKVLISICLVVVFIVVTVVSLPAIIFDNLFGLNENESGEVTVIEAIDDLTHSVVGVIEYGYKQAVAFVSDLISVGDYDYDKSMESLSDYADTTSGYDTNYILAAYSVSMLQQNTTKDNMIEKLMGVADLMFPVTYVVKEFESFFEDPLGYIISEVSEFVECVIHPFDNSVILKAFNLNLDAKYGEFDITCGQAVDYMTEALRLSMEGD